MKENKAIFFDRDGVLNRPIKRKNKPYSPLSLKKFIFLPNVKKTIDILSRKYLIIVITNQPEVFRSKLSLKTLDKINIKIKKTLKVDDIFMCTHDDSEKCKCRKPKIGMLIKAKKKWNINLEKSYVVGDRWKDIEAGNKARCKTVFLDRDYDEQKPINYDYKIKTIYSLIKIVI